MGQVTTSNAVEQLKRLWTDNASVRHTIRATLAFAILECIMAILVLIFVGGAFGLTSCACGFVSFFLGIAVYSVYFCPCGACGEDLKEQLKAVLGCQIASAVMDGVVVALMIAQSAIIGASSICDEIDEEYDLPSGGCLFVVLLISVPFIVFAAVKFALDILSAVQTRVPLELCKTLTAPLAVALVTTRTTAPRVQAIPA